MAKNTSVILGDHYDKFVADQLASGRYATASEILRAGLRMLEEHSDRVEVLRAAIQEGIDSGPAEPFDFDDFIESKLRSRV